MNDFTTEIVQTLVTKGDLNELFRSHLEKAINTLLRTELTAFLDYEKYDRTGFNSGNSRNGSYFRSIKTEYGELTLEIPRDRNGEFKQQTLPAYKRTNDTLETTIIPVSYTHLIQMYGFLWESRMIYGKKESMTLHHIR